MKKILLFFFASALALAPAKADDGEELYFQAKSGGALERRSGDASDWLTVGFRGSRIYSNAELRLELPWGVTPYMVEGASGVEEAAVYLATGELAVGGGEVFPSTVNALTGERAYSHTIATKVVERPNGLKELRVLIYSPKNESLLTTEGALFHVKVEVSPFAKAGMNDVNYSSVRFATGDASVESAFRDETGQVEISAVASVDVNVSAADKFATLMLPFDAELPEGLLAFTAPSATSTSSTSSVLNLVTATTLQANTPYIIYAVDGFSGTLSGTVSPSTPQEFTTEGLLTGRSADTEEWGGYALENRGGEVAFYAFDGEQKIIGRSQAFIDLPVDGVEVYTLALPDDVTGIATARTTAADKEGDAVYDLQGRRVCTSEHGIYIIGGRKQVR